MPSASHKTVKVIGLDLEEWCYESCTAHIAEGEDWATVYDIESYEEGRGHATKLLLSAKEYYENQGKRFGGSIALNNRMRRIYIKLNILEYT